MAMGGGSAADDGRGFGGFGGLGIGNPGSYGGQQSVGAPGFAGGYEGAGGISGGGGAVDQRSARENAMANREVAEQDMKAYQAALEANGISKIDAAIAAGTAFAGVLSGNPVGVAIGLGKAGTGLAKAYNKGLEAARATLEGKYSDEQIANAEAAMTQAAAENRSSMGGTSPTGGSPGGDAGGGLSLGSNIGTPPGGVSMSGNSLSDQVNGLFGGDSPQFDLNTLMKDYTEGVQEAGEQYDQSAQSMKAKWEQFTSDWDRRYDEMMGRYQSLDDKYAQNADLSNQVLGQYVNKINSIPKLNLTMPGKMGGGQIPLAPKNWTNTYSQQAATVNDTLSQQLKALDAQRGSFDSQTASFRPWASATSTGLANQGVIDQNRLREQLNTLQASKMTPFHYGYETYDRDKQLDARQSLAEIGQPNSWDLWAPVGAAALSDSGGISDLIDSIGGLFKD